MKKQFIKILALLTLIYSCENSQKNDTKTVFDDNLMIGEWHLDSSSNRYFSCDRLILLEDGSFYLFSGSDGGSLFTKGKKYNKNSIATNFNDTLIINLIDSNRLNISDSWPRKQDYYKRTNYVDYRDNLKKYMKADSLRKKVIGWWKLISSKMPVKLINYKGYYEKFTLNIRGDGGAVFYLGNKLDSTVEYSYKVNPDGIDFDRGCIVGSDSKVSFDVNGRMKLILDGRTGDTLVLERLTDIK